MSKIIVIEEQSGRKVMFGDAGQIAGLKDVSLVKKVAKASGEQFEAALDALGSLIAKLERTVDAIPNRPSKVEIEFGASLTGDCDLWVVSGEGKAEFKVKLAWETRPLGPKASSTA